MPYITKEQYSADKRRLTRAQRTGHPIAVLIAVEKTLAGWDGKAWPDDWHRWSIALYDAWFDYETGEDTIDAASEEVMERFRSTYKILS